MDGVFDAFMKACRVPYETRESLQIYEELLKKWNENINLVSSSTLPQIWNRHFLDSAQFMQFIPESTRTLADMGSGAGFPGLVLAILAKHMKRDIKVYAIESTGKKADFLQTVVDKLELGVVVRRERVEAIRDIKADVITARAMKPLPDLFDYAQRLIKPETVLIFPKGRSVSEELTEAAKWWTFKHQSRQSLSDDSGTILIIRKLAYRNAKRRPK